MLLRDIVQRRNLYVNPNDTELNPTKDENQKAEEKEKK